MDASKVVASAAAELQTSETESAKEEKEAADVEMAQTAQQGDSDLTASIIVSPLKDSFMNSAFKTLGVQFW